MIHKQFSIHDSKAGAFLPPFILPRQEMAQRTFSDCINSEDHQFGAHPDDYTLFLLGHWDDETAQFVPIEHGFQSLGNGVEYLDSVQHEKITDGPNTESKEARYAETRPEKTSLSDEPPILASSQSHNSEEQL